MSIETTTIPAVNVKPDDPVLSRYEVSAYTNGHTTDYGVPYELKGPRGARYLLVRNAHTPHMMFAMNGRHFATVDRLGWFSDEGGQLRSVR